METKIYAGLIREDNFGDNCYALFVGESGYPIAFQFQDDLIEKNVSVEYWISETEKSKEDLLENIILRIFGCVQADYTDSYSDLTGYLWTDEDLNVGGHDLLKELKSHVGKFLYMEVKIHDA